MTAPRVVATDLDGTIVRSDGTISPRTRSALTAAESAGAMVVIVTGRPPRWLQGIAEETGHRGLAICANGALVYDLHTEQVLESHPLAVADARRLVADIEVLLSAPVAKLLARHEQMGSDELLARARAVVGEQLATLTHSSADGLLEISAAGISKASTLETVCAERGLRAADAVAFGDMPNDLPMLAWAGRSVAVANAPPEVLAVADEVTASNDDDGVALVLERWFPQR